MLSALPQVTQEIVGFFIVENHVLNTTGSFRSQREVEDLWDALVKRVGMAVDNALRNEADSDAYLAVKECLLSFIMTLEVCLPTHVSLPESLTLSSVLLIFDRELTFLHPSSLRAICCDTREEVWQALRSCQYHPGQTVVSLLILTVRCRSSSRTIVCRCMSRLPLSATEYWTQYG